MAISSLHPVSGSPSPTGSMTPRSPGPLAARDPQVIRRIGEISRARGAGHRARLGVFPHGRRGATAHLRGRWRASAAALIPRTRAHRHPGEIGVRYRAEVEIAGAGCHAGERLGERHRRGRVALRRLVEAHRVDAGDDVVAQVRGLEATRLQGGDDPLDARVDLGEARGVVLALPQARRERALAETVDLLEERAVGAARKARRLLIHDAERQQFGRLELLTLGIVYEE